jgi:hypothetical protein
MGDVGSQTFPGSDRNPAEIVAWIRKSRIWSMLVRLLVVTEGEVSWAIHEMRRNPLGRNTPEPPSWSTMCGLADS